MKFKLCFLLAVAVTILILCPVVSADIPPTATPETQGFSSATAMQVLGTATESDSLTWQISNINLDGTLSNAGGVLVSTDGGAVLVPHLPVFDDILNDTPGEVTVHRCVFGEYRRRPGSRDLCQGIGVRHRQPGSRYRGTSRHRNCSNSSDLTPDGRSLPRTWWWTGQDP